jgi:hypothetical protein
MCQLPPLKAGQFVKYEVCSPKLDEYYGPPVAFHWKRNGPTRKLRRGVGVYAVTQDVMPYLMHDNRFRVVEHDKDFCFYDRVYVGQPRFCKFCDANFLF